MQHNTVYSKYAYSVDLVSNIERSFCPGDAIYVPLCSSIDIVDSACTVVVLVVALLKNYCTHLCNAACRKHVCVIKLQQFQILRGAFVLGCPPFDTLYESLCSSIDIIDSVCAEGCELSTVTIVRVLVLVVVDRVLPDPVESIGFDLHDVYKSA